MLPGAVLDLDGQADFLTNASDVLHGMADSMVGDKAGQVGEYVAAFAKVLEGVAKGTKGEADRRAALKKSADTAESNGKKVSAGSAVR